MTTLITERNLSLGWLAGLEHLLDCGGKAMNVIVAIERPEEQDAAIRQLLDEHIADRSDQDLAAIGTVANTIFPQALYRIHLGDAARQEEEGDAELRTYAPGDDRSLLGFPCLSHVSLTLAGRRLHLTALYRNQHFIKKAYGNYVGLSRLLAFLCREVGCEAGEIVCVASHADAEIGTGRGFGRGDLLILAKRCRAAAGGVGLRIPA